MDGRPSRFPHSPKAPLLITLTLSLTDALKWTDALVVEQMIALLDFEREQSFKCRHYDRRIPCLPRIFTTNLNPHKRVTSPFPRCANDQQQDAIMRRVVISEYMMEKLHD